MNWSSAGWSSTRSLVRTRALRVKAVYAVIIADLQAEAEIDTEVDRILATYSRQLKPVEQDVLRRKHKEEVARKRGFVL